MDSNILGAVVLTFIETQFPGGLREFTEQGGVASAVSFEEDTALIYHPSLPKRFSDAIESLNNQEGVKIRIVEDVNFKDMSIEDIMPTLVEVGRDVSEKYKLPCILYNPLNPLVLTITIPFATLSKKVVQDIASTYASRLPALSRGILIIGEEKYPFSGEECFEIKKPEEAVERVPITQDTITDLRILLSEDMDVLELINKL